MAVFIPIGIQLARFAATAVVRKIALRRVAAGAARGPVTRAGYRMQGGAEWLRGGWASGPVARTVAPNLAGALAKPTVPLGQRIAAQPSFSRKVGTALGAPLRPIARNAPLLAAGYGEHLLYAGTFGRSAERNRERRNEAIASGVNYEGPDVEQPDWGIAWGAETNPNIPKGYQGPVYPEMFNPSDIVPATPPAPPPPAPPSRPDPTTPVGDPNAAFERARADFDRDLAALNSSFASMLQQVKSMYQLSETEEEKSQLRFTLADMEAQYEAGKEAIATLYSEKVQTIQVMATQSREYGQQAAEAAGATYSNAAIDLQALQEARNAAQVAANRGLGIGAAPGSSYVGALEAMAPIASQYAQRIADIGSQGLDYMAATTESMGAARQGELQSLYAGRTADARTMHARRVAERIANERLAKAAAVQDILGRQISMQQSMMGRRPQESEFGADAAARNNRIEEMAARHFASPQNFANQFASEFGRAPTEEEWMMYESYASYFAMEDDAARREREARARELGRADAMDMYERLFELLPPGIPQTVEALRQYGILPR